MIMTLVLLLILLIFAALILIAYALYRLFSRMESLEERFEAHEKKEERRHSWSTQAGLEDSLAIVVETILRLMEANEVSAARLRRATTVIGAVIRDPYGYQEGVNQREQDTETAHATLLRRLQDIVGDCDDNP